MIGSAARAAAAGRPGGADVPFVTRPDSLGRLWPRRRLAPALAAGYGRQRWPGTDAGAGIGYRGGPPRFAVAVVASTGDLGEVGARQEEVVNHYLIKIFRDVDFLFTTRRNVREYEWGEGEVCELFDNIVQVSRARIFLRENSAHLIARGSPNCA